MIQQNFGQSTFLNNTWSEMLVEEGDPSGEYWIGLETMHQLTKDGRYKLRLDMQARNGIWYWEEYDTFIIQGSSLAYRMDVYGYTGNNGEIGCLFFHNGSKFATWDVDSSANCAASYNCGWWYNVCFHTCLNCNNGNFIMRSTEERSDFVNLQRANMTLICKN